MRWVVSSSQKKTYDNDFFSLSLNKGTASGTQVKQIMMKSGLSSAVLASVWNLADITQSGKLDADEFAL